MLNYFKPFTEVLEDFKSLSHADRSRELDLIGNNYHRLSTQDVTMVGSETMQTKQTGKLYRMMMAAHLEILEAS